MRKKVAMYKMRESNKDTSALRCYCHIMILFDFQKVFTNALVNLSGMPGLRSSSENR